MKKYTNPQGWNRKLDCLELSAMRWEILKERNNFLDANDFREMFGLKRVDHIIRRFVATGRLRRVFDGTYEVVR